MEAALALGMSRRLALRRVIVPQAVRIVIPPVTNDFIALFKDTSVCSVITLVELTKQYSILGNSTGGVARVRAGDGRALHGDERAAFVVLALVGAAARGRRPERRGGGMIEVRDLAKRYGAVEVLRGVSLAVARGEVAVIIGPSGGGKSTFLRCLNGLETFRARLGLDRRPELRRRHSGPGPMHGSSRRSAAASAWSSRASTCFRTGPSSRT